MISQTATGPWLYPGDIVIMDYLSIHKRLVVREVIAAPRSVVTLPSRE